MAVSIKDFAVGQPAYKVIMNKFNNKEPEIYEVKIKTVGRKYVTIEGGWETRYSSEGECGYLEEDNTYGYKTLLFPTKCAAYDHISAYKLRIKIRKFVSTMAFDNMELRELERIDDIIEEATKA